jgi:radical SAM protein with 4Fe4S-binding SPASM domain
MECAKTTTPCGNKEYLQQFNRKAVQHRTPLSGSIDLTHRCNLRCVHCYVGPQPLVVKKPELNTERILSVIDEITDAECLYLLITGGEPLLRKDFVEIYNHAKMNGLLVTVFTNGTLITDRIIKTFETLPPQAVEISLYGATALTYEKITGVKGSFKRCLSGIRRLLDRKIQVKLKTVLMTLNHHDFFEMEHMAKEFGVPFRLDPALFPRLNGDKAPLTLRVSPPEAVEKEFSDPERLQQWREFFERYKDIPVSDTLYHCGAGVTSFHIDAYGNLQPCLMTTNFRYNIAESEFAIGWHTVINTIQQKKAPASFVCNECERRVLCSFCPAFFKLESGVEDRKSDYLCSIGTLRHQRLLH